MLAGRSYSAIQMKCTSSGFKTGDLGRLQTVAEYYRPSGYEAPNRLEVVLLYNCRFPHGGFFGLRRSARFY